MSPTPPPPRLLLGTALLFWGATTGHALVGLVLALLVEACHWTRLRWDFDEPACVRAWRITVFALVLTILWFWFDGKPYTALLRTLGWLPAVLLPLQCVQAYGLRETMWLRTFTFFSQQQRDQALRYGTAWAEVRFNFGYVYLVAVMLGAMPLGTAPESPLFLPGLVVLAGWGLLASRRCRWPQVWLLMAVAWGIGIGGQHGLDQAYRWYNYGMFRDYQSHLAPDQFRTAIGRLGEIKQSSDIVWRVRPQPGSPVPTLLRTTSYNRYCGGTWINLPPLEKHGLRLQGADQDFDTIQPMTLAGGESFQPLRDQGGADLARSGLPRFTLRGAVANRSPLPLPGDATGLLNFDVESCERNSLGTVLIFPKSSIANGTVVWRDRSGSEQAPRPEVDVGVHESEQAALRQILAGLRLDEQPTLAAKLLVLRRFFQGFEYTRYNTISTPRVGVVGAPSAITVFLTQARRGHCEYFATAACLLLREAGIPSRYAIGYALCEHDAKRGEWVVRGLHGHAWTRVWDETAGQWLDFDPTPPSWLATETGNARALQWVFDAFRRVSEDFELWRSQPLHRWLVSGTMLTLGTAGLLFIVRRLWRSKQRVTKPGRRSHAAGAKPLTPLHQLEKAAARHLPPRPLGQPFGAWLAGLSPHLADPATLTQAIALHQQLRFDPTPPPPTTTQQLHRLTAQLQTTLNRRPKKIINHKS